MRKVLSGILMLLLAAGTLTAQTNEWKQYKNTNGNFTVLFPGEPTDTVNKTADGSQSHTLLAKESPAVYTVIYTVMTSEQPVDDATFQAFRNGVFKELPKCETSSEQTASPAIKGYIGHAYRLNCEMPNARIIIVGNLYWGKRYAYAVMAMFPANVEEPAAATKKLVESFAVIDPAK